MALITVLGLFVLSVITAAFSRILAEEIGDWSSWAIHRLIRNAIVWLPENLRERFAEEWQSHVNDVPGRIGKLCLAVGFLTASYRMEQTYEQNQLVEEWQKALAELVVADSKTLQAMSELEAKEDLPSREEILPLSANIRTLMSQSAICQSELAARVAKVSCTPTTLTGRALHAARIRVLRGEFRELTQHVLLRSAKVSEIRARLGI